MTVKHEAFIVYAYFIFAYADGLISPPDFRKTNLGSVQRAGAIPPPPPLLWLRRNCCYQNFCRGIRMIKNEPTEYVQALADTTHVKITNNLLQPRSFDRDEHCAQTGEQISTLSDYIALAVLKEGITGKYKLCQSWRPALILKWVSLPLWQRFMSEGTGILCR